MARDPRDRRRLRPGADPSPHEDPAAERRSPQDAGEGERALDMDSIFDNSTVDPSILADRHVGARRWDPEVGDWVSPEGVEITNTYSMYDDAVAPLPPGASLPPQPVQTEPGGFDFPEWAEEGDPPPSGRSVTGLLGRRGLVAVAVAVGVMAGVLVVAAVGIVGWMLY